VKKAKIRSQKEKEINQEIIDKYRGHNVTYGTEIQLMHQDSTMFLTGMSECSKTEQIGYAVAISLIHSSRMNFKFLPKFKSRVEGDLIQYTDIVKLQSAKNNHFLSISPSNYLDSEELFMIDKNPFM